MNDFHNFKIEHLFFRKFHLLSLPPSSLNLSSSTFKFGVFFSSFQSLFLSLKKTLIKRKKRRIRFLKFGKRPHSFWRVVFLLKILSSFKAISFYMSNSPSPSILNCTKNYKFSTNSENVLRF